MIMEKTEAEFAKLFKDVSEVNLIDGVRLSLEMGAGS